MNLFVGVAASYLLVAILGFVLGRIYAEFGARAAREADSWERLPDVDWAAPAFAYDWVQEEVFL